MRAEDCPIVECEFSWDHTVHADHSSPCGCYYFNAGIFGFCPTHEAEENARSEQWQREHPTETFDLATELRKIDATMEGLRP